MKKIRYPHLAWIWHLWKEKRGLIALLMFLTLLSSAVAVAFPLLTKELFDTLQRLLADGGHGGSAVARDTLGDIALSFAALGVAGLVSGFFPGVRGALNVVFDYLVRTKYFAVVTEKDHRFFSKFASADIVTRLTSDINDFPKLAWFLCSGIFRAVESTSKVLFCAVAMLILDWRLALASLASLPVMLYIFSKTQNGIYDRVRRNEEAISRINEQLELSFSGVRIIKAFARESTYRRFFSSALESRFSTEMGVIRLDTILNLLYQNIDYVAQIALVFAGGMLAVAGSITIGTFYAFYNYLNLLIYPILDIPQLFISGKRAFVNMDRLEEMADFPPGRPSDRGARAGRFESLSFENVDFAYAGREKPALENVSFTIERGRRLLVIGPVGSGKTTLVKLMAGLLDPESGRLVANGRALEDISRSSWAGLVGYVPQEALLFAGTIDENVAFGLPGESPKLTEDTLAKLLKDAQIADEIASFPEGGRTNVGQRGSGVSGGQRQRLAIARALARNPELLLLDDMTASLDTGNEENLWKLLSCTDKTIVAVSHRLSSIQYADKVLFLKEGRVAGFGTHEELFSGNPEYRDFVAAHLDFGSGAFH